MHCVYIRSSSYNEFSLCEHKYFLNYILGIPSPSGKKAELGSIVHKVLEYLALYKIELQKKKKVKKIPSDIGPDIDVSKDTLFSQDLVKRLNDISFDYYSNKSIHEYTEEDRAKTLEWVNKELDYKEGVFDPRKRNIVAAEQFFDLTIEQPWAKYEFDVKGEKQSGYFGIKGTIDLITDIGNDTLEICDYKTGKRISWTKDGETKDYEALQNDIQLLMYYYAISRLYPDKHIIITIFYINDGGPFTLAFNHIPLENVEHILRQKFVQINNCKMPKRISNDQTHWKCKYLCTYGQGNYQDSGKSACQFIHEELRKKSMKKVIDEQLDKNHSLGSYNQN